MRRRSSNSIARVSTLSTWQLIRGRYVLDAGTVEGVRIHYFVNEDGVTNLPRPPADPDDPGRPIEYLIADLQVPERTPPLRESPAQHRHRAAERLIDDARAARWWIGTT